MLPYRKIAGLVVLAALAAACSAKTQPAVRKESADSPQPVGSASLNLGAASLRSSPATVSPPEQKNAGGGTRDLTGAGACPQGMVLIEGEYCPDAEQKCLEWMDPPTSRYHQFRCAHYAKPSVCKSKARVHMRYCIDATERMEPDSDKPRHFMSWTSSKKLCEAEGGRLCRESEWVFACEGEEMRPYPYGFDRDSNACNVDIAENIGRPGRLVDHRAAAGSHAQCASPFGVHDMAGNVEEWVQADGKGKMGWKEVLKGSWWIPSRHACRQFQVGHNDVYNGGETGTRCCKDAPPADDKNIASR